MKTLLIYGLETVAGANIANTLSDRYAIVGIAGKQTPEIRHCQILSGKKANSSPATLLRDLRPDFVLDASCCGDSPWNPQAEIGQQEQCEASLERAKACAELGIPLACLSSDAVLTGPWMFHEETAADQCSSILGQRLAKLEQALLAACPQALVVRTHPFGWDACSRDNAAGWVESLLARLQSGKACHELNHPGYATPILASELAGILDRAFSEKLTGLYHIAGAERVSRVQFARRLAECFQLSKFRLPVTEVHFTQSERKNFACGESSLQTRAIRKQLCVAMPTLTESMDQLALQQNNGYLNRLCGETVTASLPLSRAA